MLLMPFRFCTLSYRPALERKGGSATATSTPAASHDLDSGAFFFHLIVLMNRECEWTDDSCGEGEPTPSIRHPSMEEEQGDGKAFRS